MTNLQLMGGGLFITINWTNITFIATFLGLVILIWSGIRIYSIYKELGDMEPEAVAPQSILDELEKNIKLGVIGTVITALAEIVRIFLR